MKACAIFDEEFAASRQVGMRSLEIAQRFNAGLRLGELGEVPSGTADPCLFGGASFVPVRQSDGLVLWREGTSVFLCHNFPSVETLGYFREHRRTAT
jgi:hypothetical protein